MKEISEEILDIIIRDIHDIISMEEKVTLDSWKEESEKNKELYNEYLKINKNLGDIRPEYNVNLEAALLKVKTTRSISFTKYLKYAAAIVLPLAMGVILFLLTRQPLIEKKVHRNFAEVSSPGSQKAQLVLASGKTINLEEISKSNLKELDGTEINLKEGNSVVYDSKISKSKKVVFNELRIPRGGEYQLVLSDGTKVWLNSESELRYPISFKNKTREVYLVGEAFFDVSHDKTKPFIVHSGEMNVEVLGTRFNVRNYPEDNAVATLVQGKVKVLGEREAQCILNPGQQARLSKKGIVTFDVDTDLYTSWIEGKFLFKNVDMYSLSQQISRWYNVEIFFVNDYAKNVRFTGSINKDKPLQYLIELIESTSDVRFSVKGKSIVIEKK